MKNILKNIKISIQKAPPGIVGAFLNAFLNVFLDLLMYPLLDVIFPKSKLRSKSDFEGKSRFYGKSECRAASSVSNAPHVSKMYSEVLAEASDAPQNTYSDVAYYLNYKDAGVKASLWKFKYYLGPAELRAYTYILYDELVSDLSDRVSSIPFSEPIMLTHCPSSTYFKGNKKFDHMRELVLRIDELQCGGGCAMTNCGKFFTGCTHAILPNPNATVEKAQHTGTRAERLHWSKERFVISEKFEEYLMRGKDSRTMHKPTIYCIDDVVTTGSSLNAISRLLHGKFELNVRKICICH